jgi:hypothetical protein
MDVQVNSLSFIVRIWKLFLTIDMFPEMYAYPCILSSISQSMDSQLDVKFKQGSLSHL